MKKLLIFLLLTLCFMLISLPTLAQAPEDDHMLDNAEVMFPRTLFYNDFSEQRDFILDFVDNNDLHVATLRRSNVAGERSCEIYNYSVDTDHYVPCYENALFYHGAQDNFWYSVKVQKYSDEENVHCFVEYTTEQNEPDHSSRMYFPLGGEITSLQYTRTRTNVKEWGDLSAYNDTDQHQVDIIRQNGTTYMYVDYNFITKFKDEFKPKVSVDFGVYVNGAAGSGVCYFDDMVMYIQ